MNRSATVAISALLLAIAAPLANAEGVKIGKKIPYAQPDQVREAIRKECDLENQLASFLAAEGGNKVEAVDDVAQAKGKAFDAKITGVWAGGGPWGAASIQVEGELREAGKVVGTVTVKRNTTRGGGACSKLHVSGRVIAEDLVKWLESPSMGAKLGDAK